jgi:FG-GAP-like repeat
MPCEKVSSGRIAGLSFLVPRSPLWSRKSTVILLLLMVCPNSIWTQGQGWKSEVSFIARRDFPVDGFSGTFAVGDFNGDERPDVAVVKSNSVSVLLNRGHGSYEQGKDMTVGSSPNSMAVGDFNGDGQLDLAVGCSDSILVLLGNGDGTFQPPRSFTAGAFLAPWLWATSMLTGEPM